MTPIFIGDGSMVKVGFNWKNILLQHDRSLGDEGCKVGLTIEQAEELISLLKQNVMWKKRWHQLAGRNATAEDRLLAHKKLQKEMLEYNVIEREAGV